MSEPGSLRSRLRRALAERARATNEVVRLAEELGVEIYLVGGPVRDLLLGRPIGDIDLLISDALENLAERAAERLGAKVRVHERFLTATLECGDIRIDLSRARTESYPRPGALPEVRPALPEEDLARRDFTVHAMALPLGSRTRAKLLDPHGGRRDLEQRALRVLHERSFSDDPTRLFRAARYCGRLGFRLERRTLALARAAIEGDALATLSADRISAELSHALGEATIARVCRALEQRSLFNAVTPGWRLRTQATRALRRLERVREAAPWAEAASATVQAAAALRILLLDQPARIRRQVIHALGVRGRPASDLESDAGAVSRFRGRLARGLSPGTLDRTLMDLSEPALLALHCAGSGRVPRDTARFAASLRHLPSPLDGHEARRLGAEGPAIGALVSAARVRALDGRPTDPRWARRWLARYSQIR